MLNKLMTVCVAVENLDKAIDRYVKLFDLQVIGGVRESAKYGYRIVTLGNGNEPLIELAEPTDPQNALAKFIKAKGEGIYLVAIEVDNLKKTVKKVRSKGGRITGIPDNEEPGPDTGWVWIHPKSAHGAFLELVEKGHPSTKI